MGFKTFPERGRWKFPLSLATSLACLLTWATSRCYRNPSRGPLLASWPQVFLGAFFAHSHIVPSFQTVPAGPNNGFAQGRKDDMTCWPEILKLNTFADLPLGTEPVIWGPTSKSQAAFTDISFKPQNHPNIPVLQWRKLRLR